jgi:hypothetical protein
MLSCFIKTNNTDHLQGTRKVTTATCVQSRSHGRSRSCFWQSRLYAGWHDASVVRPMRSPACTQADMTLLSCDLCAGSTVQAATSTPSAVTQWLLAKEINFFFSGHVLGGSLDCCSCDESPLAMHAGFSISVGFEISFPSTFMTNKKSFSLLTTW